jgi:hypothetical protein
MGTGVAAIVHGVNPKQSVAERLMMASTLDTHATSQGEDLPEEVVAVVDAAELEAASHDPRVRSFLTEADAYLVELERHARNR